MRAIPQDFQTHLTQEATTLCTCWRLVRKDGAVFGFTDHDAPLSFLATEFAPQSGFLASQVESNLGLNIDTSEVEGALSLAAITAEDIDRGHYDEARLETYQVNWQAPEQHLLLTVQTIGEITRAGGFFKVELRGLADSLNRVRGRQIQRSCDAVLGQGRCKVNLDDPSFRANGAVTALLSDRLVQVTGLSAFADGWFTGGALRFTSGPLSGLGFTIVSHVGAELELDRPVSPDSGDQVSLTAGCDKSFATCRDKFANSINFQGFPHIPGDDFALSYPNQGGGNDGSMLS